MCFGSPFQKPKTWVHFEDVIKVKWNSVQSHKTAITSHRCWGLQYNYLRQSSHALISYASQNSILCVLFVCLFRKWLLHLLLLLLFRSMLLECAIWLGSHWDGFCDQNWKCPFNNRLHHKCAGMFMSNGKWLIEILLDC